MTQAPAYNRRRFFRLNTQLPLFFAAEEAVHPREIYTLRTDYFSPYMRRQVEGALNSLHVWLGQVQEHRVTLERIFSEMEAGLTFFGETLTYITEGIHPRKMPNTFFQFQRWQHGFDSLHLLEQNAPRTHTFISQIEEKFKYYLGCLEEMVKRSDENHLYAQKSFKVAFPLDATVETLSAPRFARNPLVQSILSAVRLLELYIEVFRDLNNDHAFRNSPNLWPTFDMNISGGGLSFHTTKGYKNHQLLDIGLYLPMMEQAARFKGRIVNIMPDPKQARPPRIAVNFEFPDGHDQCLLISELQRQELERARALRPFQETGWYREEIA